MFSRGNIVKLNFNPTMGHEQGDYRPAIVMNDLPLPGGLSIVLPITSKAKSYPLEVELDHRTNIQGVILCFQIRTVDLTKRNAKFIEKASEEIMETCADYVRRLVSSKETE